MSNAPQNLIIINSSTDLGALLGMEPDLPKNAQRVFDALVEGLGLDADSVEDIDIQGDDMSNFSWPMGGSGWRLNVFVAGDVMFATYMYEELRQRVYVTREIMIPLDKIERAIVAIRNKRTRISGAGKF